MLDSIRVNINKYKKEHIKKRNWQKRMTVLASIVVFITTYALIIPAITMEKTLICEIPEHTHTEKCYDGSGILICDKQEHTHIDSCYDAPKEEKNPYKCGKVEHIHTENCYFEDGNLKCTINEHVHTDECKGIYTIESNPASDGAIAIIKGVIPENAVAKIDTVKLTKDEIAKYLGNTKTNNMSEYVAYDVKIMVGDEGWQPDENVNVVIKNSDIEVEDNETLEVVHVDSKTNEASIVSSELDENGDIGFTTDGFSLYIAYTVDFNYLNLNFSIAGGSEILLSELWRMLGIDLDINEVKYVNFSNDKLIQIEKVNNDWKIISLEQFNTEETLSIEFLNGEVLIINVTDAVNDDPVWVYHSNSNTPYGTFTTLKAAVTNASLKANDIVEIHGDITESGTSYFSISKSIIIRSEMGINHIVQFNNIADTGFGMRIASSAVVTFGGNGYGNLTFDMNNSGSVLYVPSGTKAIIEDGTIFTNSSNTGNGGAIRVMSGGNLNINGGVFENNSATKGGAISSGGTIHISGGKFINNNASIDTTESTQLGNSIYQAGSLYLSGNPEFEDDQDIYIGETYSIIKEGAITSTFIPVKLSNSNNSLNVGRNILTSGAANVEEEDLEKINVLNHTDLDKVYVDTAYKPASKPSIVLAQSITDNLDNFIDDDYVILDSSDARSKTASWINTDKSQAEINISENSSKDPVLVIGSLCTAHGLSDGNIINNIINTAATNNDVDYYFSSYTAGAESQFEQKIAGVQRGPFKGSVVKGATCNQTFSLYSGAHNSAGLMALKLTEMLQEKKYSEIIMIFDNTSITSFSYRAFNLEEQIAFYQAANLLKPYYSNNQVTWISAANKIMYKDYETGVRTDLYDVSDLLIRGIYTSDTSQYHYDTKHVTYNQDTPETSTIAKYDKFNSFFAMALFDPETWLEGVNEARVPDWEEYNLNTKGVVYTNLNDILDEIANIFNYDKVVISDVVDNNLQINTVYLNSCSDGETWVDITNDNGVDININGQTVTASITNPSYYLNELNLRIICDCPGEFKTNGDKPRDTNIGNAEISYYFEDDPTISYELISPKLYKSLYTEAEIKKTFRGLTQNQINSLAEQFKIVLVEKNTETPNNATSFVLTLEDIGETNAELPIDNPEQGMDNGKTTWTYTWEIDNIIAGTYTINEYFENLDGYYVERSGDFGDVTIIGKNEAEDPDKYSLINDYDTGYILPGTGGIGVEKLYMFGILLMIGSTTYGYILFTKNKKKKEEKKL